ncbi:cystathionine beta-lyase [Emcibacter sp.]|uniref:cystathionine beta-lyase n=1 Tax=Emcibacter sp. TaxID=1979954 RepID=UPI002AA69B40|nr:cystathionine beta-lyase [Emcibacter sp.]
MKKETKLVEAGRRKQWTSGIVNPPVYHASTVIFETVADMREAVRNRGKATLYYGRRGTPTHFAFQDAMCELEGGAGCALYPSGLAAVSGALLSFLETGDHILMVDGVYEPTRTLCDDFLKGMGVETTYYDPMIGSGISDLIQSNTKVVFVESPCSLTMEVQDIPAIAKAAHARGAIVLMDNTWGTPLNFKPFDHGVDVSIHAATKYIVGHSDAMLGTATANEKCWDQLREKSIQLGYCAAPDDVYLGLRGLRTMGLRLKQHEENALEVALWLKGRPEVDHVRHPAFENCPGHEVWKRDFLGSCGLFSFVMTDGYRESDLTPMLDNMELFKMGFSWGGYESLILPAHGLDKSRTTVKWQAPGPLVRLHVGLENPEDLIADLEKGFARIGK